MANELVTISTSIEAQNWLAERDAVITRAATVTQVTTDDELETAGKVEADGKKLIKLLEEKRKEVTRPIDAVKKQITDKEKELRATIEKEVKRINAMTTAYATAQALKREEELRRIAEAEQRAAEAAVAAEETGANALFGLDSSAPAMPTFAAPTTNAPHTSSNRFVETWDFVVYDPLKVPRELLSVDETKIRALLRAKKAEGYKADQLVIPGIKISMAMRVQSR